MKNVTFYKFEVNSGNDLRLDQLIAMQLPEYSRSRIKNWIDNNNITINGKTCSPKDKIHSKSSIEVKIFENEELDIKAENIPLNILHEDDDIIVIDKESGMVTHTAPGNYSGTLQNALLFLFPCLNNIPRAGIIHRLDKYTSGVIVIAKNLKSHNFMTKQIQSRKVKKIYNALVCGIFEKNLIINQKIGRHKVNRKKMTVIDSGREAVSKIKVITKYKKTSFLEVDLVTGRTHQIRVHLSHLGFPVIGDKTYGFKKSYLNSCKNLVNYLQTYDGHTLHAKNIEFTHPGNSKIFSIESVLPKSFIHIKSYLSEHNA